MGQTRSTNALLPYVPRMVLGWIRDRPEVSVRELEGTLAFVDISGFTRLSERLARRGKVGAEVLTDQINESFAQLMDVAYEGGGSLLKFGGDALLLWFEDVGHEARACRAAVGMRRMLRRIGRLDTAAGSVTLRLSGGVHSGTFHFFLVGESHRELVVAGPGATHTVLMESIAQAGQIVVSEGTAAAIPPRLLGEHLGAGHLLAGEPFAPSTSPVPILDEPDLDPAIAIPVAIRDHLSAGGEQPEHRQVTVAFIHVGGLDGLVLSDGPQTAAATLHDLLGRVQRAAESHDVALLATDVAADGTKIILTAGAPRATGDHEERMLLTLRQIVEHDAAAPLKIGVNRGPVFAGDVGPFYRRTYTVMGDPVNLAARLMGAAAPGLILTVQDVLARSRTQFRTAALDPFMVKGKAKPVQALAVGPVIKGGRITRQATEAPLIGRDRELGLLRGGLESVRAAQGRVIEVVGEPGIGKSRVVHEALRGAEGITVVWAVCQPYESSTPFFALAQVLRVALGIDRDEPPAVAADRLRTVVGESAPQVAPWLPLLAAPLGVVMDPTPQTRDLDERFRQSKLGEETVALLGTVLIQPVAFVIEDAQWMDEASAQVFRALAAAAESLPWLILVTRRDGPGGLSLPEAPHTMSFRPSPLASHDAETLAERLTEDTPVARHEILGLVERSGGNPLFLEELLAARASGVQELPDSVGDVISARIDRLDPAERSVLRQAAVLGTTFTRDLLVAAAGPDLPIAAEGSWAELDEFIERDAAGEGTFRFRQTLVRDAAYEGLSFRRRQSLHARVGEAILASSEDPDEQSELLSLHFFHAGRHQEAWRFGVVAARRASAKVANAEAAQLYQRALEAARKAAAVSGREVAEVQEALGDLWDKLGDSPKAEAAYRTARRLLAADPLAQGRLLLKEAYVPERVGRYSQALRRIARGHRAVEAVEGTEAASQRAKLSAAYAAIVQAQGRPREAIRWCRRAIAEAELAWDRDALGHAYFTLSWAYSSLGDARSREYGLEALAIYEELGNVGRQGLVLNYLGALAYWDGEWDLAMTYYERGREARERTGDPVNAAMGTANIGEILSDQGHLDRAEEHFRAARRAWRAAGYRDGVALAATYLGRVAARDGRFEEADALFAQARAEFEDIGDRASLLETDVRIAECSLLRGEPGQALTQADGALRRAEEVGGVNVHSPALHRIRGLALALLAERAQARAALETSLQLARARNAAYEVAVSLSVLAALGRAEGAPDPEARVVEDEGRAILDRLGVVSISMPELPARPGGVSVAVP